jgi:hypothetical protein
MKGARPFWYACLKKTLVTNGFLLATNLVKLATDDGGCGYYKY